MLGFLFGKRKEDQQSLVDDILAENDSVGEKLAPESDVSEILQAPEDAPKQDEITPEQIMQIQAEQAKQAPPEQLQAAPPKSADKPHKGADGNDFGKMQDNWAKQKADIAHANLVTLFETDDDMPLSRHILLLAIFGFFILFFLWANVSQLDEIARGEGKVIPSSEVQVVQTLDAGTIDKFFVREGDEVEKGQLLIRLSDIQASSDLGANNARYLGLLASITRLQAEAEGKRTVDFPEEVVRGVPQSVQEEMNAFRATQQQLVGQTSVLQQQLSQREQEVRGLQTRINDTRSVLELQREEKAMVEPLVARGSAPRMELLQLERTIKERNAELNSAMSSLRQARGAVNEAKARIREIKTNAKAQAQSELAVKLIEINELKERQSALTDRKERTELVSPVNGIIQDITNNTIGGVVRPGEEIIKIIPKDDKLIVEAQVKPSDRAFIYPTQRAIVKITSYDFAIYGGLEANVVDISADTVEDDKGNSFYRVRLETKESELKRNGQKLPIIPGMVASVDILTGKKTVMQYMLKPLIKTLDVAFTER